jgi:hypothetical protein
MASETCTHTFPTIENIQAYTRPASREEDQVNTSLSQVQNALRDIIKEIGTDDIAYMNADGVFQLEYGPLVIKIGSRAAVPPE